MLAGHDGADTCFAFGNRGEGDAGGHQSLLEEGFREVHRQAAIAGDDWRDGSFAGGRGDSADIEAEPAEFRLEVAGVVPETVDALRLLLEEIEGGDAGCGNRWRMRGREEKRPGAVVEEVNEILRPAHVAAQRADGLGKRAHL